MVRDVAVITYLKDSSSYTKYVNFFIVLKNKKILWIKKKIRKGQIFKLTLMNQLLVQEKKRPRKKSNNNVQATSDDSLSHVTLKESPSIWNASIKVAIDQSGKCYVKKSPSIWNASIKVAIVNSLKGYDNMTNKCIKPPLKSTIRNRWCTKALNSIEHKKGWGVNVPKQVRQETLVSTNTLKLSQNSGNDNWGTGWGKNIPVKTDIPKTMPVLISNSTKTIFFLHVVSKQPVLILI